MRKKCYIYTRVSTAAQTEGYSLEAQTERLRKYADYKEMEVVREYCDAGRSGMSIKGRPDRAVMENQKATEIGRLGCRGKLDMYSSIFYNLLESKTMKRI